MRVIRTSGSVRGEDGNILAYSARGFDERPRPPLAGIEPVKAGVGIRLQDAAISVEMALGMVSSAIARVVENRRGRVGPAERTVITDIDPGSPGRGLALGQHRHCRVVPVHAFPGKHMRADQLVERAQEGRAAPDLVASTG